MRSNTTNELCTITNPVVQSHGNNGIPDWEAESTRHHAHAYISFVGDRAGGVCVCVCVECSCQKNWFTFRHLCWCVVVGCCVRTYGTRCLVFGDTLFLIMDSQMCVCVCVCVGFGAWDSVNEIRHQCYCVVVCCCVRTYGTWCLVFGDTLF